MNFINPVKGLNNYINKKKISETVKTVIMFGICIGIYFYAVYYYKTNKTIWSIVAVLGVLPAAKSAVSMIMFYRFKSLKKDEYESIRDFAGSIPMLYELVFTNSEKAYFVKACACVNNTIIMFSDDKKLKTKELSDHVNACINREELKGYSLKVYSDINQFNGRLKEMNDNMNVKDDVSHARLFDLFKAVTL